jgi:hypothetical protein
MADIHINPTLALEVFQEGRETEYSETVFTASHFCRLLVAHNAGELGLITDELDNDQVEDRLLGLAVRNTLDERRRLSQFALAGQVNLDQKEGA